jgi:hypothetical protein
MKHDNVVKHLKDNKNKILKGTMLAVDPSSGSKDSRPGYALFESGKLVESGTVSIDYRQKIDKRLQDLQDKLEDSHFHPDILIIERIRGMRSHIYLHWAVGVIVATIRSDLVVEMPTSMWRKYVTNDYIKSDAMDAVSMGVAAIQIVENN